MAQHTFLAFVDDAGAFALDDKAGFRRACQSYKGEEVVVILKKKPKQQGSQAMRFYRGVVIPDIAEACGYDAFDAEECDQVHEAMAWKFLRIADHPELAYPRRRSTAKGDLSQDEMARYIDQVIEYAEREIVGCRVRRPGEVDMDQIHATEAA